jgi:hypothetical protein
MLGVYDDHGIRFMYPIDWELEVSEEGPPRTMLGVQEPGGLAFLFVTIDDDCPAPEDLVEEAVTAMREEYPALDAYPAEETIAGHTSVGYDVEFFSLDMLNSCVIRAYRTPNRTVLVFGQWSDLAEGDAGALIQALRHSLEETDDDTEEEPDD